MADDQTLLSLPEAARITFPDGRVKASGLRRERDKGRLRTYKVANKEYTTLADLAEMLKRCSEQGGQRSEMRDQPHRVDLSAAKAAALASAQELKSRFTRPKAPRTR
jgi:hypothetical protein